MLDPRATSVRRKVRARSRRGIAGPPRPSRRRRRRPGAVIYSARMTRTLLLLSLAALAGAQDYTLGPESQPQPNVPKGTVTKAVLAPGKFYPGTPHNYQVYVPAQYDAARPTPFMIFLDGS